MKFCLAAMFGMFTVAAANGGVIFATGNNPQTDEPVLFHDSCSGCVDGPGALVIGHTQTTNLLVYLATTGQIEAVDPGHNTVSTPGDAGITDLNISIPGYTFTSIILNLTELSTAPDGTVTFLAHTLADGNFSSGALFENHTGGNFYTILATSATRITSLDINTTQLQHDISQIRIGGAQAVIPEPATFGLVGMTLVAGALFLRRRQVSQTSSRN